MAHNRKDKKNRVLHKGEYQRTNGRYEYRYTDIHGKTQCVYSWRLNANDPTPRGKPKKLSLRELEQEIERDLMSGIDTVSAGKTTLNDFFEEYIEERPLKQSTRVHYRQVYTRYVSGTLGSRKLSSIKYSDITRLYNSLIDKGNLSLGSVEIVNNILHPIFTIAVRDDIIRKNPTDGVLSEIRKQRDWSRTKRKALSQKEQQIFVDYVLGSRKYAAWVPLLIVFLGTGCRIGEVTGLRWQDCDFEHNLISINHTLTYLQQDNGKRELHITSPKTAASVRLVPMFEEVKAVLLEEYEFQRQTGFNEMVIDGYSGFLFKNRYGGVYHPANVNQGIERIRKDYNAEETERAQAENREPVLLPHFTAHNLRHTFCSRLCENESDKVNLKLIQEVMGHSSIDITLDVYTDLTTQIKQEAFASLEGKIKLG